MAPLPKRRHSSRRGGKRERINLAATLSIPNRCPKCNTPRRPHRACGKCGYYK